MRWAGRVACRIVPGMAPTWQAYPSAFSNGVYSLPDTFIDADESIGSPADAKATSQNSTNSAFALLKGICDGVGIEAGSGAGVVNTSPKVYGDPEASLGLMSDAPATSTGTWSAISLLKGILAQAGI